jgi:predicted ArsR family transcriptional regulator
VTAPDRVLGFLAERGPAPTSEIAQALSEKYGHSTVRAAIIDLKKKGVVVDTGERQSHGRGRPEHIVALERELELAKKRDIAYIKITNAATTGTDLDIGVWGLLSSVDAPLPPVMPQPSFIQRVKRWFGGS